MSDNPQNETDRYSPSDSTRRTTADMPRRGYERRRDATGTLRPPSESSSYSPPPVYGPQPGTPPPPRRGRSGARAPRDSGLYLPWWSLLILIGVVGLVAVGLLLLVANLSGAVLGEQTPQVIVVTSAIQAPIAGAAETRQPALSPGEIATAAPSPESEDLPTPLPSRTPVPGGCLLGEDVIVRGTGGVGLNLRDRPGGEVAFIAKEGERMVVIDGPQIFNDIEWCQVRSVAQSSSFGWASKEYIVPSDDD